MPFTLWSRDLLIGETDFELGDRGGTRHIGVFRPAPSGMMLLPSITAMAPALFEFGLAAKRAGFSAEPEGDEADACLELLEQCGPGQRMLASAKRIAELELRDPDGRQIHFESILVSDLEELRSLELGDD